MPPPSEAALRYTIIDRCLTNPYKPYPTMDDLKREIERELKTSVSTVTIQKDIAHMKKPLDEGGYDAPIKFKRSNQGYYYDFENFPNFTIRTLGLNEKELEAIELATGVLQHFKGIKVNDTFNHAIDKLLSAVDIKKSDKDISLANAIQPEESTYMRGMEHFETIVTSIRKKRVISFIHYSYSKKLFKAILIHPYLMKESNKRWYVVGYSEEHKNIRSFGLDRVYDPMPINTSFKENKDINLRNLFENKIGLTTIKNHDEEVPEKIEIRVSPKMANYVKSMPLHKSQSHIETDGHGEIIITLRLVPTYELIALILSYSNEMELLKPLWLRHELVAQLNQTIKNYKK